MGRPKKNKDTGPEESKSFELREIKRDEKGLIEGVFYSYNKYGGVDWRKMVPDEFLYVNPEPQKRQGIEEKYGKKIKDIDIKKDDVEDIDLVINLAGIKYLLRLRGFKSVKAPVIRAEQDYVAATSSILFKGNYETENEDQLYEDNACAHLNNTARWYGEYLVEAATNRAFCRCVRNFLNISIVSKEELGGEPYSNKVEQKKTESQVSILQKALDKNKISWEQMKEKIKKAQSERGAYKDLNVDECNGIEDFPKDIIFDLLDKLKNPKRNG